MRLQCPNCDAEYEVDTSAIPFEGRDVQCSNCGHGWFQSHPDFEADYEVESALYDPPPPLAQGKEAGAAIPRRELDPEALRVLREEVALEEAKRAEDAARASKAAKAAPQTDGPEAELDAMVAQEAGLAQEAGVRSSGGPYGGQADAQNYGQAAPAGVVGDIEAALDADQNAQSQDTQFQNAGFAASGPRVAPRRVARLKGFGEDVPSAQTPVTQTTPNYAAPQTPPYRAQSNASAQPQQGQDLRRDFAASKPKARKTAGGRFGFYLVMLLAIGAAGAYIFGPELANAAPELAEPVGRYTAFVNQLRDQVDVYVPQALEMADQAVQMANQAVQFALDWVKAQGWI
jgi:predicted Zn finger-like uncharacterized protein